MYSDAEAAALYDVLSPWDPEQWPGDAFYRDLAMDAASLLDVGCGTGGMLHHLRDHGHSGRLTGLDPNRAALDRARARNRNRARNRRSDIEWVLGTAAEARWSTEFDLATMTGHAFQCLVTDEEVAASLSAVRAALHPGGRFVFETRHPQARAWQDWHPGNAADVVDAAGRPLRVWHRVDSVTGDLVSFTSTTAAPDGSVLRVDRTTLRFLAPEPLDGLLAAAGFEIEARYGDWDGTPVNPGSHELITIARRP